MTGQAVPSGNRAKVLDLLQDLNVRLEELTAVALRGPQVLSCAPPDDTLRQACADHLLDYRDVWPDVQVSTEILDVADIDLNSMTFFAEVRVNLDWEETDLVENIHYHYDLRTNRAVLSDWLLEADGRFDPEIYVTNAVTAEVLQNNDRPSIHRSVRRPRQDQQELMVHDIVESLWFTKEYHFKGSFKCSQLEAHRFPFDMHRLPLHFAAKPLPGGLSSLGELRRLRLLDPRLRLYERCWQSRQQQHSNSKVLAPLWPRSMKTELVEAQPVHVWGRLTRGGSSSELRAASGEAARLRLKERPGLDAEVADFIITAFGGKQSPSADDTYTVELIVSRDWRCYQVDFLLRFLLALICLSSIYVPYTDDMLPNRLSITLAIVLTLVSFALSRAPAIEKLTYSTYHDTISRCFFGITVLIGLENLLSHAACWGTFRYGMSIANALGDSSWSVDPCETSFCGSNHLDCIFGTIVLAILILMPTCMMIVSVLWQLRFLIRLRGLFLNCKAAKSTLHSAATHSTLFYQEGADSSETAWSQQQGRLNLRLVTSRPDGSSEVEFKSTYSEMDIASSLARTMPVLYLVPRFWIFWARQVESARGQVLKAAAEKGGFGKRVSPAPEEAVDGGNRWIQRHTEALPSLESQQCFVVEIGTAEMRLFRISPKVSPGPIFVSVQKVPFSGKDGFVEQFLRRPDGADGATQLAEAWGDWIQHYSGPVASSPSDSPKVIVGVTGQVRDLLRSSAESMDEFEELLQRVEDGLVRRLPFAQPTVEPFVPSELDEAILELSAVEWMVQVADLDVTRTPPGFQGQLFAGFELSQAFARARVAPDRCAAPSSANLVQMEDFLREFRDLVGGELRFEFLTTKFRQAVLDNATDRSAADFGALWDVFRGSPKLMRTFVKRRLFAGMISADDVSCQVTIKDELVMSAQMNIGKQSSNTKSRRLARAAEVISIPLGRLEPLVSSGSAQELLTETQLTEWQQRIQLQWAQMDEDGHMHERVTCGLRGFFVGAGVLCDAAELAECSDAVLPKALFLEKLKQKLQDLIRKPSKLFSKDGEDLVYDYSAASTLALVYELVSKVLAETAWIVCKRRWHAQPASLEAGDSSRLLASPDEADLSSLPEYDITWVLGFYLNQSRLL